MTTKAGSERRFEINIHIRQTSTDSMTGVVLSSQLKNKVKT